MIGFRVVETFERPAPELVTALGQCVPAHLGDCMNRVQCMTAAIRCLTPQHSKLFGVAFTVRTRPGDNLMVHKALELVQPGDVLVVDAGGDACTQAIVGELMCQYALRRGVAGMVIDGLIRDREALMQLGLPVFARGSTPAGPYKEGPGEINLPIHCGGVVLHPGDIVVADADGVVVVPRREAQAVLEAAHAHAAKEEAQMDAIAGGTWDRSWIDETLRRKGAQA